MGTNRWKTGTESIFHILQGCLWKHYSDCTHLSGDYYKMPTTTHTQTHIWLTALCPGLPRWACTRNVKPIWILLEQETVSGSGTRWAICKSAPRTRQTTTPAPHRSVFLQAGCPSCRPTNTVKALKAKHWRQKCLKQVTQNQMLLNRN